MSLTKLIPMTINDQMRNLWEKGQGDLGIILQDLLQMEFQAQQQGILIDLDLLVEIYVQANYSLGMGNELKEAQKIGRLLHRCHEESFMSTQVTRLFAIMCSSVLTHLTLDVQNQSHTAHAIIRPLQESGEDLISTIRAVLNQIPQFLSEKVNIWAIELVSFYLVYLGLLQVLGLNTNEYLDAIHMTWEKEAIREWKENWNDRNDYFRLNCLLITQTYAPDDLWIHLAEQLVVKMAR